MNNPIKHIEHPYYATAEVIQRDSEQFWSCRACWWQAEIAELLLWHPKHNLVATAPTGLGKTYTFFLPGLYETGVTFIIIPLKKLGGQHAQNAQDLGFTAINLDAKTISKEVVKAHHNRFLN